MENISFIAYESMAAQNERTIKRLWLLILIMIIIFFSTNAFWIFYISQYNFESYEISTDGGGNANYIGQDGDIYNGASES